MSRRVLEELEAIDAAVKSIKMTFGIHCPPGCGVCCESSEVEASVLEMLPIAEELWARGEADAWLTKAQEAGETRGCIFYTEDKLSYGKGRCGIYPWRPTVCRLFGNAAIRNKQGRLVFAPCGVINSTAPRAVSSIQQEIDSGLEIPVFSEAAQRVANIDPGLGVERFLIGKALVLALERVGFLQMLRSGEKSEPVSSDDRGNHPTTPKRPNRPKRAA